MDGSAQPSRQRVMAVLIGIFVAVLIAAALVGRYGRESGGFDWSLAAETGTAAGTTLLAFGTGWLAWTTSLEMTATRRLAEQGEREERGRNEAWLVIRSAVVRLHSGGNSRAVVQLANAGNGAAIDVTLELSAFGSRAGGSASGRSVLCIKKVPIVMPGEIAEITIDDNQREFDPDDFVPDQVGVYVQYFDRSSPPGGPFRDTDVYWDWQTYTGQSWRAV